MDDMSDSDDEDKDGEGGEKEEKKEDEKDEKFDSRAQDLQLAAHSNTALCNLKLNDGVAAFKACEAALKLDPANIKCLFRRGQAAEVSQDWEDAIGYFKALLEVDTKNTIAANRIKFCRSKLTAFKAAEKKRYANMFARTNFKEPEEAPKDSNLNKPDFSDGEEEEEEEENESVVREEMEV